MCNPRYEHDCSVCTYLGSYKKYDCWFHSNNGVIPSLILRHGSNGSDYTSFPLLPSIIDANSSNKNFAWAFNEAVNSRLIDERGNYLTRESLYD